MSVVCVYERGREEGLERSYFYLYKEGNFGSIGNVSRDGILFVA